MRKLILKMSITLDGFVGGASRELDWIFKTMSDDAAAWTVEKVWQAGAHVMGRKTFDDMAAYWPHSTEVFAAPMNAIPKIVFSKKGFEPSQKDKSTAGLTGAEKSWAEPQIITGDLAEGMKELKRQDGKDLIAHGGAGFAQSLVQTGLIDEFWLLIHPVALGQGLSLFGQLKSPLLLKVIDTKSFSAGAIAHMYRT
jgi:dihydrofolate reductase